MTGPLYLGEQNAKILAEIEEWTRLRSNAIAEVVRRSETNQSAYEGEIRRAEARGHLLARSYFLQKEINLVSRVYNWHISHLTDLLLPSYILREG